MTTVYSFDPLVSIINIFMDHVSFLSLNVCLIIHIWWGLLLLNVDMYQINKTYSKTKGTSVSS